MNSINSGVEGNAAQPVACVRPLQGTDSEPDFSNGNTLPLVARPWGMTHWTPQTNEGRWVFSSRARVLQGIRATHQPSPWIGDYGHFVVMAQTGALLPDAVGRASSYRQQDAVFAPHYFCADLLRYETRMEVTPTSRCARFRVTFPSGSGPKRILFSTFDGDSSMAILPGERRLVGSTTANSGGVPANFKSWLIAEFDCPVQACGLFTDTTVEKGATHGTGAKLGGYVELAPQDGRVVEFTVATSFISAEQALKNAGTEVAGACFDALRREGETCWNTLLKRFSIETHTPEQRETFYTCLYRSLLFPRDLHEPGPDGKPHYFSPYDGQIHAGRLCADNGFWDTHRTVYPLLSLAYPERLGEILDGWLNACRDGGWLPTWSSPGYRACMIGTHADAIFADAIVKGIPGFCHQTAYEAIRKDAFQPGDPGRGYGRAALTEFDRLGYVPSEVAQHGTARTLDFAFADFAIAQAAQVLGRAQDSAMLMARAAHYQNVFDPAVGFMRGRSRAGWDSPFDEFAWGGPFIEASAWQQTWAVPHDALGLATLMGGPAAACAKLDRMFELPPRFTADNYQREIHEMSEMASVDFGQYAHSNQPVHHVLYLYTALGRPHRTQYWVRRVLSELYSAAADGLPGDDDNGEMTAWYVLSALGIYPLTPSHPTYVLGAPLFPYASLKLEQGGSLEIHAPSNRVDTPYVAARRWNQRSHDPLWISHQSLAAGGVMEVDMSRERSDAAIPQSLWPYSMSMAPGR